MLDDPDIRRRLGRKGNHHRRIYSGNDNLDPEACAVVERNDPVHGISVNVCIDHVANMACRMPIRNPASKSPNFRLTHDPGLQLDAGETAA